MTDETTGTIDILDRIGERGTKYDSCGFSWTEVCDCWTIICDHSGCGWITIRRKPRSNKFDIVCDPREDPVFMPLSGMELIEKLAELYPVVAKKLANPGLFKGLQTR